MAHGFWGSAAWQSKQATPAFACLLRAHCRTITGAAAFSWQAMQALLLAGALSASVFSEDPRGCALAQRGSVRPDSKIIRMGTCFFLMSSPLYFSSQSLVCRFIGIGESAETLLRVGRAECGGSSPSLRHLVIVYILRADERPSGSRTGFARGGAPVGGKTKGKAGVLCPRRAFLGMNSQSPMSDVPSIQEAPWISFWIDASQCRNRHLFPGGRGGTSAPPEGIPPLFGVKPSHGRHPVSGTTSAKQEP